MNYKEILFDTDSRKKIQKGVNITADAVGGTLGPRGMNVIFEETIYPTITKDGVTVAQQIYLKDKFENLGVMIARQAAENTNTKAGDGTTTTVVLLQAIFNEGIKYVEAGMNPILIKKGLNNALQQVIKLLNKQKKEIKDEDILRVATISANNDDKIGKLIYDVIKKIGKDGIVTLQNSNNFETEVEYIKGMKVDGGFLHNVFINDPRRLVVTMENPTIIVATDKIDLTNQILPLIERLVNAGKTKMVLFADKIQGSALAFLVQNYLQGKFICVPVQLPSFGDYKRDLVYDLSTLIQSKVIGEEDATALKEADLIDCGTCNNITIHRDFTVISGGQGEIASRVAEVKTLLEQEKNDLFRTEKLKERLGRLTGAIANIKIGGSSEVEQAEKRYRMEDAFNATKHAVDEGVVEGGGVALLKCLKDIKTPNRVNKEEEAGIDIIKHALSQPIKKIVENSGKPADVVAEKVLEGELGYDALNDKYVNLFEEGILDPIKVVVEEIRNAVSTAGTLLTSSCAIVKHVTEEEKI